MKQELENYQPAQPEYILSDAVREEFPLELDFKTIEGAENKRDAIRFIGAKFTAVFPENEYVERKMDDFEKRAIREEYCVLVENTLPSRKREMEEAIEEAKRMKKEAEERYAAALQEVYAYAAEVKQGIIETKLKGSETFKIALAGYYLTYTWNEGTQTFVLAKAEEIPDCTDVFSQDENNRGMMLSLFGAEFPYPEQQSQESGDDNADF